MTSERGSYQLAQGLTAQISSLQRTEEQVGVEITKQGALLIAPRTVVLSALLRGNAPQIGRWIWMNGMNTGKGGRHGRGLDKQCII